MVSNSTRFGATLSLHSVNFLIQGLQAEIDSLPALVEAEGAEYAELMVQTIETELASLVLTLKASGHGDIDCYLERLEEMSDSI